MKLNPPAVEEVFEFSNHLFYRRRPIAFSRFPPETGKNRYPVNPVDPV